MHFLLIHVYMKFYILHLDNMNLHTSFVDVEVDIINVANHEV